MEITERKRQMIRRLTEKDLLDALHLSWEVFIEFVAPGYTDEGIRQFQKFITYAPMQKRYQEQDLFFWGAYEQHILCGVIAVDPRGHINLLFVKKEYQRKGIARRLMAEAEQYCSRDVKLVRMTVNAAPNAAEAYRHLGFIRQGSEQMSAGIRYIPMAKQLPEPKSGWNGMQRETKALVILGITAAVLLFFFVTFLIGVGMIQIARLEQGKWMQDDYEYRQEIPYGDYDSRQEHLSYFEWEFEEPKHRWEHQSMKEWHQTLPEYGEASIIIDQKGM